MEELNNMNFSMEVADTEVIKEEITKDLKVTLEDTNKLKALTENNVSSLMELDINSLEDRRKVVKTIEDFGMNTIENSSKKNSLLQMTVGDLSKTGGEGGAVAKGLADLHREMKDLDPSAIDFTKKGILGKLFNPLREYFQRYERAENAINDIIISLDKGEKTLKNDNTTLEIEEVALRNLTKKLAKEIEMGKLMDEEISKSIEIAKSNNENEDKIRFVSEEILFPLRQRVLDMQQMITVNQQGIMAMEVVRRNNKELIRGVERAKTVTISALKIATMVAGALYNQKIVLKKIEMINETTNNLISGTARMLKEQGADIQREAMEANISVDTLKEAFKDTMDALDAISNYKEEALPRMKEMIMEFNDLAEKGEERIRKLEEKK